MITDPGAAQTASVGTRHKREETMKSSRSLILAGVAAIGLACCPLLARSANAQQQQARPNILVIFGDDIGQSNISAYSHGLVGYKTPNIDRIAKEGMMFTDYYAENSCTAGRSTF